MNKAADRVQALQAQLAALHAHLAEQVATLATGPAWRRWLNVASRFHSYSFPNTVLLLAQKPDATRVAGYRLWQQLGRQVNKGEKGLVILAPVTRRIDSGDGGNDQSNPGDDAAAAERRLIGYRKTHVWDISQTSGDPLPEPPRPALLAGQAPPGLWDAIARQCADAGYEVARKSLAAGAGPNGYTDFITRQIVVRDDVDDAQAVKTLIHELSHAVLHSPASFDHAHTAGCRDTQEVEAESIAYLVCAARQLDTSEYTFAYVAGWAAQTGDIDATLRRTGSRVLTTAHQILHRIEQDDHRELNTGISAGRSIDRTVTHHRRGALTSQTSEERFDPATEPSVIGTPVRQHTRARHARAWAVAPRR